MSGSHAPERMLTMSSGGWALVCGGVIALGIVVWRLSTISFTDPNEQRRGDGTTLESYGFDLAKSAVPKTDLVPAKMPKNYVMALVDPDEVPGHDVPRINKAQRGKFLVPMDEVIGVAINGEARAYPLRFMIWHEIVNDTLGGEPIAVTYNFLTDSVAVFKRTVGGTVRTFRVSGIVYQSNLVMYDEQSGQRGESLWSQMRGDAIAGPATGAKLVRVPSRLLAWGAWYAHHKESSVLKPPPRLTMKKLYNTTPRPLYRSHHRLLFPVQPMPAAEADIRLKERVIVVTAGGLRRVYPLDRLRAAAATADPDTHTVEIPHGDLRLRFTCDQRSRAAEAEVVGDPVPIDVQYANWFGWHAFHTDDPIWSGA